MPETVYSDLQWLVPHDAVSSDSNLSHRITACVLETFDAILGGGAVGSSCHVLCVQTKLRRLPEFWQVLNV